MKRSELTKLTYHTQSEATLFSHEANVIVALTLGMLDKYWKSGKRGTFRLEGQKYGDNAVCLIRYNLSAGKMVWEKHYPKHYLHSSEERTALAIGTALNQWSDRSYSAQLWETNVGTCVIISAAAGRFAFSLDSNIKFQYHVTKTDILKGIAEIFAQLSKEDKVLQDSVDVITGANEGYSRDNSWSVNYVREQFDILKLPELITWKTRRDQIKQGEPRLFFKN